MTFDDKTRKNLLFFSGTLFLIALIYRILNPFTQPTVKELTYKGGNSVATFEREGQDSAGIKLLTDLFFTSNTHPSKVINDLFYPPVPAANRNDIDPDIESRQLEDPPYKEEDTTTEPDKNIEEDKNSSALTDIVNEIMHLRILGACKKDGKLSIFIKDSDSVVVVSKGDKIKDLYPVTRLTQEYILIKIPEFNEDVRINLKDFNENRYL